MSTDVVGHLVGVMCGAPSTNSCSSRILQPLGMPDTALPVPGGARPRSPSVRGRTGQRMNRRPPLDFMTRPPHSSRAAAGWWRQRGDYLRFCQMLLGGGELDGVRLLGPKTVRLMRANHLPGGSARRHRPRCSRKAIQGIGFGLGFAVTQTR